MAAYHYLLNGAFLQITCSDSKQAHVDEARFPEAHDQRFFVQQPNSSPYSKDWRKKLGEDLAIMFLLQPESQNIDYILTKFPKGYILICDEQRVNHVVERVDAYLYSDEHRFRSPAEFLPHAAWLIAGKPPGCCRCKYCCTRGVKFSQKELSKHLINGYKEAMDERQRKKNLAANDMGSSTLNDEPLVKVFLKAAPGSRQS